MRLEQRMKLSPQMIQAMEILQLPLMALQERIDAEMEVNPVLELNETSDEPAAPEEEPAEEPGDRDLVVDDNKSQKEDFARLDSFDAEYEPDMWNGETVRRSRAASDDRDPKLAAMANAPAPAPSLYDYLMDQWAFWELPDPIRRAGALIIESLDEDGYLRDPLESLPERTNDPVTLADLKTALPMVQRLDPTGVGARDLKECLLIQLNALAAAGHDVQLEREIVRSFLRDVEMNHLPLIARKTGQPLERVKEALARLGRLTPRPGRLIGGEAAPMIVPDIYVELDDNGEPIVLMADAGTPDLRISDTYAEMVRQKQLDPPAREFLQKNIRSANWLIGAIRQRRDTVRRVAQEVFREQKDFFEGGRAALKPLPMATVAERVGVHVATVSRAVAGKYVQTPRGIYPLRMFFAGGTTTAAGEDLAWDAVKAKLQEIIASEDKARPLKDDELVEKLAAAGITLARRTVAKYRNMMNIPPARQRKEF